jgi:hypothetical protein
LCGGALLKVVHPAPYQTENNRHHQRAFEFHVDWAGPTMNSERKKALHSSSSISNCENVRKTRSSTSKKVYAVLSTITVYFRSQVRICSMFSTSTAYLRNITTFLIFAPSSHARIINTIRIHCMRQVVLFFIKCATKYTFSCRFPHANSLPLLVSLDFSF